MALLFYGVQRWRNITIISYRKDKDTQEPNLATDSKTKDASSRSASIIVVDDDDDYDDDWPNDYYFSKWNAVVDNNHSGKRPQRKR